MYRPNGLKARLNAGDNIYGAWIGSGSPANAEILGHVGFDFVVVDQEHGAGELADAVAALRAVESSGTPCMVRAPWNDPIWIKRILDAGAESLMIPQIETAAAAKAAVSACRYPPQGMRGYAAGVVRASTFGLEPGYVEKANQNLLIVLQIESAAAVEHAAEICAVEGVDVVFIGVNDLAGSIGRLEQLDHPGRAQPGASGRGHHPGFRQADGHGAERRRLVAGAVRSAAIAWWWARTTSSCCARPPVPPYASMRASATEPIESRWQRASAVPRTDSHTEA